MQTNWNLAGLILEGICGSGKTTILRSILQSDRYRDRPFLSAVVLSEHHTQRVLERQENEAGLTPEDSVRLLDGHVSHLESLNERLARMDWLERNRTGMRVPYVFERFHFTHACHYPHVRWDHVEPIDRRLAALNCRVCVLTVPEERIHERIIAGRDAGWRDYLRRHGSSEDEIVDHYRMQQERLLELRRMSVLPVVVIDTTRSTADEAAERAIDFWGIL